MNSDEVKVEGMFSVWMHEVCMFWCYPDCIEFQIKYARATVSNRHYAAKHTHNMYVCTSMDVYVFACDCIHVLCSFVHV